MNSIQGNNVKKKSRATFVTTVVSCHKVPKPLRNFKFKQGFSKKEPISGRKSLESSSSFLSSGTSSLHTQSSSSVESPNKGTIRRVLPPDEYYEYNGDSDQQLDQDDGIGRSSESCTDSPLMVGGVSTSCSPVAEPEPEVRKSVTPSDKGTSSTATTANRPSLEGDSGHGDFEEELQFSSVSSPSQFDPISETESDSCSYTYSYYTCSNSCCSGSYSDEDEEYCFSRTDSGTDSDAASDRTELQREAEEAAERESRAVAQMAAQAALSKSYRAYFKRVEKLKRTLENWDNFLRDNGIRRPDFFCRYKERESLQQIVDEFNEVTKRHREGILTALRSAAAASVSSSNGEGRGSASSEPSLTESESSTTKNAWRNKRIRKLLSIGSPTTTAQPTAEDTCLSLEGGSRDCDSGNGKYNNFIFCTPRDSCFLLSM